MVVGKVARIAAVLSIFIAGAGSSPSSAADRTIVFIPGIMGSRLCEKTGGKAVIWGDSNSYLEKRLKKLKLGTDETLSTTDLMPCGIIREVVIIPHIWEQTYYSPVLDVLKNVRNNQRVLEFDYDWRFSNKENAVKLRDKITGLISAGEKVDIVAHSMGGLIARIYIQELGGANHTHALITMGTPHRGSALMFQRLKEGLDNWPDGLSGGLGLIRSTILSFRSMYEMLPAYSECCFLSRRDGSRVVLQDLNVYDPAVWQRFGWLPSEYRDEPGKRFLANQLSRAGEIAAMMRRPVYPDGDKRPVVAIASAKMSTWSRVFFDAGTGEILEPIKRPGDGTVLLFSASNAAILSAPSFNEHVNVFVGEAPVETLRRVLSDIEWHGSADSGDKHQFKDGTGRPVTVSLIELLPNRRLYRPGEKGSLSVSFQGGDDLVSADLSVITAATKNGLALVRSGDDVQSVGDAKKRGIKFEFDAPAVEQPFVLSVRIPGLEPLEVVLLSEVPRWGRE